jgi:hypothetical protein
LRATFCLDDLIRMPKNEERRTKNEGIYQFSNRFDLELRLGSCTPILQYPSRMQFDGIKFKSSKIRVPL